MKAYNYINRNIDVIVKLYKAGVLDRRVIRNIEIYEYTIATSIEEASLKYGLSSRQIYSIKKQMETKI